MTQTVTLLSHSGAVYGQFVELQLLSTKAGSLSALAVFDLVCNYTYVNM